MMIYSIYNYYRSCIYNRFNKAWWPLPYVLLPGILAITILALNILATNTLVIYQLWISYILSTLNKPEQQTRLFNSFDS